MEIAHVEWKWWVEVLQMCVCICTYVHMCVCMQNASPLVYTCAKKIAYVKFSIFYCFYSTHIRFAILSNFPYAVTFPYAFSLWCFIAGVSLPSFPANHCWQWFIVALNIAVENDWCLGWSLYKSKVTYISWKLYKVIISSF